MLFIRVGLFVIKVKECALLLRPSRLRGFQLSAVCFLAETHFLSLLSLCCSVKCGEDVLFAPVIRHSVPVKRRHAGSKG